jgi:pimeloyl-ACP methyl ester carboxylesterase
VTPRLRSLLGLSLGGFHRVAYWEWGREDAERTVVCVHGLTRQGRDFDVLARALAREGCRVVCPDLVGRGRSDWLHHPAGYTLLQYGADMNALLARLDVDEVDWIGNSLGGLVGMLLAAQPHHPIRRLVINDIGPFIPGTALRRLGLYLNAPPPRFPDLAAAEDYIRTTLAPFGALTDAQWRHLTEHSVHPDGAEGGYRLHHDPGIAEAYRPWRVGSVLMWEMWDKVRCPTLVLRGADSDLLPADTAQEMTRRGPAAELIEFDGIGHLPALMTPDQIEPILDFLTAGRRSTMPSGDRSGDRTKQTIRGQAWQQWRRFAWFVRPHDRAVPR